MSLDATVLIPTTGDRGELLALSLPTVLAQTVRDIEVFIIGDGVSERSRSVIEAFMSEDSRVRFFDHPKDRRRGEVNRHAALLQARGKIVCYLCDRDLMLPDHVETLGGLLETSDFAHTFRYMVTPDAGFRVYSVPEQIKAGLSLPFVGHRLSTYLELPHGWRETPAHLFTDVYMWDQFFEKPGLRVKRSFHPTLLYFPKYRRRHWETSKKVEELARWSLRMKEPGFRETLMREILEAICRERRVEQHTRLSRLIADFQKGSLYGSARRVLDTLRGGRSVTKHRCYEL